MFRPEQGPGRKPFVVTAGGACKATHAPARTRASYLAARHARIWDRRGNERAAIATGHAILIACWHMLPSESRRRASRPGRVGGTGSER